MVSISALQGSGLWSPLAGKTVRTRGVVTGHSRRGFFIQDPVAEECSGASHGVFVYSPAKKPPTGSYLELQATVIDYLSSDNDKPVTQLKMRDGRLIEAQGPAIEPVLLSAANLPVDSRDLAVFLNSLEGMLVAIEAGATFIQPSNPFADYVLSLCDDDLREFRTQHGGVLLDPNNPDRWFPGFRITDYQQAPRVDVGSTLTCRVSGPLNYRSGAFQIAVNHPITVAPATVVPVTTQLAPRNDQITVLTLNGFNLDVQIEAASRVRNPRVDIDDDVGDGRFDALAGAIVEQAACPDIIALQEIQDNDGAEQSAQTDAGATYSLLIHAISAAGGPPYEWVDLAPESQDDGGQPGGNIRNGFLYNAQRIQLDSDSPRRLGEDAPEFAGSRKPLLAIFSLKSSGEALAIINLHLASKRHQHSVFAPERPGFDPKLATRVKQAQRVHKEILALRTNAIDYLVTGDFNDYESSTPLAAILGEESYNLVETLPRLDRYDYNHRGKLQVLMHGIVSRELFDAGRAEYQILHGNELVGVRPGELGDKPSDHAYVITRIKM